MMAVINTNILSLTTQNNMNKSQSALGSAIERLSSGQRINSAKDDAAGQAIANRFTSNIKGLTQASRNANDGISLAQTTEGALGEINNNLQRVRELSAQAATGSNSSSDLKSIQDEIKQRLDEIDRVSDQTQFNGVKVLAGNSSMKVQVGANDGETISINLEKIDSKSLGLQGFNVDGAKQASVDDLTSQFKATGTNNFDVGGTAYETDINSGAVTKAGVAQYIDAGTGAFSSTSTATNGAAKYTATTAGAADSGKSIAAAAVGKAVGDKFTADGMEFTVKAAAGDGFGNGTYSTTIDGKSVDFAITASTAAAGTGGVLTSDTTLYTSAVGGGLTTKAAETNRAATLADLDLKGATKTGSTLTVNGTAYTANAKGDQITNAGGKVMYMSRTANGNTTLINEDAAASQKSTDNQLATVDKALAQVDALRSGLGAVQNRFDSAITNLGNTINNLTSARSRIQDADYSTEVSNMSRAQILQQAGTSVLAQANQVPQTVLSLLR
ncbi:flagellin [Yersinia intermedia]|uniref:flagellin N-terminal helical domain-containing protein n=1 Tax=Yersinia intermedia TaxID=631 RepID=UPI0022FF2A54|nr:flagellin [Yersinia intermedia]MDA5513303.1 flagellin [Yersinia intermedia]